MGLCLISSAALECTAGAGCKDLSELPSPGVLALGLSTFHIKGEQCGAEACFTPNVTYHPQLILADGELADDAPTDSAEECPQRFDTPRTSSIHNL